MSRTSSRAASSPPPQLPLEEDAVRAAVRQDGYLLRHWGPEVSPAALLAGTLNLVHAFSFLPGQHSALVQAAAQLLRGAAAGRSQLARQPKVDAYLKGQADRDVAWREVFDLANGEVPFEIAKRLRSCESLLKVFASAPVADADALGARVAAAWVRVPARAADVPAEFNDAAVSSWLLDQATEAFVAGKDEQASALRNAGQALALRALATDVEVSSCEDAPASPSEDHASDYPDLMSATRISPG